MTLIKRTCKCCGNEFELTGDIGPKPTTRCFYCRMNCNIHGPYCKERA